MRNIELSCDVDSASGQSNADPNISQKLSLFLDISLLLRHYVREFPIPGCSNTGLQIVFKIGGLK